MARIFYVDCPACGGRFPCHSELWQTEYDLLCPFCQHSFPQEESPLIITMTGEKRPGSVAGQSPRTSIALLVPDTTMQGADERPGDAESM